MRALSDRLRHAISFEAIALLIVTPVGAMVFHLPLASATVVTVVSASIATGWNMGFNYLFDVASQRLRGSTQKTMPLRVLHAVLFELGLLLVLAPFFAWYLDISLLRALFMDMSFAAFYLVYAFVFNIIYDRLFPLPEWRT